MQFPMNNLFSAICENGFQGSLKSEKFLPLFTMLLKLVNKEMCPKDH